MASATAYSDMRASEGTVTGTAINIHEQQSGAKAKTAANPRDHLNVAVQVAAALIGVFLTAFFVVTVNNMATISSQVEEMKDGPFPAAVAVGHVETDIAQIETLTIHITHFRYFPEKTVDLHDHFAQIDANMRKQLDAINPEALMDPNDAVTLRQDYDLLRQRVDEVLSLLDDESVPNEQIDEYVAVYLTPLVKSTLVLANRILDETSQRVDATYSVVNSACNMTIVLACVLMVCVVILIGLYLFMMHKKSLQEQQLRRNLEETLALAQTANHAKSEFLSNMSHDIRTPMNAIVGLTMIADDNIDDPLRVKQCLTRIMTSSKHLLSLINDVLDMNKIESGETALCEERFSLPDLVAELIAIIQPQAEERHLHADVIINNIRSEELIGDTMRLRQVLLNLASNAIKYTPEGGDVRLIVTEDTPRNSGEALMQFVLEDTGIGMDPAFLTHVFEPFERENNEYTIFTEGTGLGLAITKNLVDLMGGTIHVESEPGKGTKFTVCLPMRIPNAPAPLDTAGFDHLHILIVDDSYLVMQNALHTLSEFGVRAEGTTSAEEAPGMILAANVNDSPFDLVIVDREMRGTDSRKTVRRIHEAAGQNVPIVVLASYGWDQEEDMRNAAKEMGVSAFIAKPLFLMRLHKTVKQLCIDKQLPEEPTEPAKREPQMLCHGRVLLVDDNAINLEIALALVSKLGIEAEGVNSGLDALVKVSEAPEGHYDLIFMDCKMPSMDGFETTRSIKKFLREHGRADVPIVAMTANAFETDRQRAFEAGMDGFMTKPINMAELEENLKKHLS